MDGKYNPKVYRYCAGYQYDDKTIVGFQPYPLQRHGAFDLGDFLIMPEVGLFSLIRVRRIILKKATAQHSAI